MIAEQGGQYGGRIIDEQCFNQMNNYEANHDGDDNGMDGEDVDGDDNTWVETNHYQSHHLTTTNLTWVERVRREVTPRVTRAGTA